MTSSITKKLKFSATWGVCVGSLGLVASWKSLADEVLRLVLSTEISNVFQWIAFERIPIWIALGRIRVECFRMYSSTMLSIKWSEG